MTREAVKRIAVASAVGGLTVALTAICAFVEDGFRDLCGLIVPVTFYGQWAHLVIAIMALQWILCRRHTAEDGSRVTLWMAFTGIALLVPLTTLVRSAFAEFYLDLQAKLPGPTALILFPPNWSYLLLFCLVGSILLVKERMVRDRKLAGVVNSAIAIGNAIFAGAFIIALFWPLFAIKKYDIVP